MKKIIMILVTGMMVLSLTACGKDNEVKEVVNRLESAINKMDVNEVLDCVNPEVANPIKLLVGTFGQGEEMLLDLVQQVFGATIQFDEVNTEKVKLEPKEVHVNGNSATVECELEFEWGESVIKEIIVFNMIKVEDEWYIDGVQQ